MISIKYNPRSNPIQPSEVAIYGQRPFEGSLRKKSGVGYRLKLPWGYQRAMLCRLVIYIYLFCLLTIKVLGLSKWSETEDAKKRRSERIVYHYEKHISFSWGLQTYLSSNRGLHQSQSFLQWTSLSGKVCDPSHRDPHPFASTGQKSKRSGRVSKVG